MTHLIFNTDPFDYLEQHLPKPYTNMGIVELSEQISTLLKTQFVGVVAFIQCAMMAKYSLVLLACHTLHIN